MSRLNKTNNRWSIVVNKLYNVKPMEAEKSLRIAVGIATALSKFEREVPNAEEKYREIFREYKKKLEKAEPKNVAEIMTILLSVMRFVWETGFIYVYPDREPPEDIPRERIIVAPPEVIRAELRMEKAFRYYFKFVVLKNIKYLENVDKSELLKGLIY